MMTPDSSATRQVLVLNVGSSSVKFSLVDPTSGRRRLSGIAEKIDTSEASLRVTGEAAEATEEPMPNGDHEAVVAGVLAAVQRLGDEHQPVAVGHRVVHGGELFAESVVINDHVVEAIEQFSALAPLHNPPALRGITSARDMWPGLPQVAVFDTAFHHTLPPTAFRYAVPEDWYTDLGVRRYGFHGTSHRFVSQRAAELIDRPLAELALIVVHLGNGCSAAAVLGGKSVDTTMGLTPLEGLVMGTRSGDIDPGIFSYLAEKRHLSSQAVTDELNTRSGLLGLSGSSQDMRQLTTSAEAGDEKASLAVEVFVYRAAKAVAALVVGLGRLDALVFTGGIGENSALVRERVIGKLRFLGLSVDSKANAVHGRDTEGRIGRGGGALTLVVPTDEELMIARDTIRLSSR